MSGGTSCKCPESKKPVAERGWMVTQRHCNHSTFNGGRKTYSKYSALRCAGCFSCWRTTASYVGSIRDAVWKDGEGWT